jgi:hypothetical protein
VPDRASRLHAVVCASAWEFGWLGPLHLRIEWLHGLADVSSMEGCVPASEGDDGTVHVGRRSQSGFLSCLVHPTGSRTVTIIKKIRSPFTLSMP